MSNINEISPLVPDETEPEYKNNPPLLISSVGTENTKKSTSQMPYGSALLTDTSGSSKLRNNGINYIIHAALMPQDRDENLFIQKAVLAMQNSIILADR